MVNYLCPKNWFCIISGKFHLCKKQKQEAEEYFKNILMNKSKADVSKVEFLARSPNV